MCERAISEEKTDARAQARAHLEVNRDFKGQMCTPRGGGSILSYFVDQQNNTLGTHTHILAFLCGDFQQHTTFPALPYPYPNVNLDPILTTTKKSCLPQTVL